VDEGRSWQAQTTGATTALLAGSSPSPAVFWAVGREGTIMLTTDGRTWRRVTPPASVDLISVTATDASTAIVTTADGRTFRTGDAGQTWTPQENPTAPF
jgi:photosystem II stability/assembly factor-like uncharacterized protein